MTINRANHLPVKSLREDDRQNIGENQNEDLGNQRETYRRLEDLTKYIVLPDRLEVAQANKIEIRVADGNIRKAEGDRQDEGETHQQQDVYERRRQEHDADNASVVERKSR